jgi:hypothetical protein
MTHALALALSLYRVIVLTRTTDYLIVSGGDALRVAKDCRCATLPPGTAAIVGLDAHGVVVELRRPRAGETASESLPTSAIAVDPRSSRTLHAAQVAAQTVTITLTVAVPADTPPGDNLYVSTERSGWNAAELRMQRVDPLHWSIQLRLPAGVPLLYRYSRGSFATLEAGRSGQLAPARKIVAKEGLVTHDVIVRFGDLS